MKKVFFTISLIFICLIVFTQTDLLDNSINFYEIQKEFYKGIDSSYADTNEGGPYVHFKRWESYWWPRVCPTGNLNYADSCIKDFITGFDPSDKESSIITSDWQELGPKSNGLKGIGLVNDIAFHPTDTNTLFCGSSGGGVWKSTNGGQNWYNLNTDDQLVRLGVSTIAVDPDDPDYIYIGTGDIDFHFCASDGVYRTDDGGNTWEPINSGLFDISDGIFYTSKILVHPDNDSVMFASNSFGIFKCNNRQASMPTWHKVYPAAQDSFAFVRNIGLRPNNNNHLYAAGIDVIKSDTNGNLGTWYSIADTNGFDLRNTPWPNEFNGKYLELMNLAIGPHDDYIYVNGFARDQDPPYNWNDEFYPFIYRYDVQNDVWDSAHLFPQIYPGKFELCVSPESDTILMGGSVKGYYSKSAGDAWSASAFFASSDGIHCDIHDIKYDRYADTILYIASDGGVNRLTFTKFGPYQLYIKDTIEELNEGLGIATIYNSGSSPIIPNQILIGNQDCGLTYHTNSNWEHVFTSDGFECLMDNFNPSISYGTTYAPENGSLYRNTGSAFNPNFPYSTIGLINDTVINAAYEPSFFGAALISNPINSHTLFQGRRNIWKTNNAHTTNGYDWSKVSDFSNQFPDTSWYGVIYAMEIAPGDSDYIYSSYINSSSWRDKYDECKLLKTSSGGGTGSTSWTDITPTDTTWFITDIAICDSNPNRIWISYSGYNSSFKVKKSTDGGNSWSDVNEGLPNVPVNCIVYQNNSLDGLFVGTDVGVFYRNDTLTSWEPFMDNLPNVVVKWLEINYTANKIRAATFGRGLWESDLPEGCPASSNDTLYISNDTTWQSTLRKHIHVKVDSGAKLTIKGTVYFGKDRKIIVDRGGKLVLDGGILRNSCDGNTWGGIQVWGNLNKSQYTSEEQGKVRIKNDSYIFNAVTAIATTYDNGTFSKASHAGGIVQVSNSSCINNQIDITFMPFRNYLEEDTLHTNEVSNISYIKNTLFKDDHGTDTLEENPMVKLFGVNGIKFTNCHFQTSEELLDTTKQQNNSLCYLKSSSEITFGGCTFENSDINNTSYIHPERGIGIYSYNSEFFIDTTDTDTSLFYNLYYGIKVYGVSTELSPSIKHTCFDKSFRGIYIGGISNAIITRNKFLLPKSTDSTAYGLYLDYSTDYTVEENNFTITWSSQTNNEHKLLGICINNSGDDFNEIYNNDIEKLNYGILAMNDNRGDDKIMATGLKIRCNDFDKNFYDIVVSTDPEAEKEGISKYQGYNQSISMLAGNLFSYDTHEDSSDYYNQLDHIIYYSHDSASSAGYNVIPKYYTSSTITINESAWEYTDTTSCLSNLTEESRDSLESKMNSAASMISITTNELEQLTDGGNTGALTLEIDISQPPEALELRNELIQDSPFLSDTVLIKAIDKEDVLQSAMIRDVLVANPQAAKSDKIMKSLDERSNQLPESMINQIEQGKQQISSKESLEAKLSYYASQKQKAFLKLCNLYRFDNNNFWTNDSLKALYIENGSLNSSYRLAFQYLAENDTLMLLSVMQDIPSQFDLSNIQQNEYSTYLDYFEVLKQYQYSGFELSTLNTDQINTLNNLAVDFTNRPGAYSRYMLHEANTKLYYEPIVFPTNLKEIENDFGLENEDISNFSIYPNPSYGYFIVDYNSSNTYRLDIYSLDGKLVKCIDLEAGSDYQIIDVSQLTSGNYICSFMSNNERIEAKKLIIIN